MLFVTITAVIECNINLEKNFGFKIKHKDDFPPKAIATRQKMERKRFVKLKVATFTGIRKLNFKTKVIPTKNGLETKTERTGIGSCRERSAFLVSRVCVS